MAPATRSRSGSSKSALAGPSSPAKRVLNAADVSTTPSTPPPKRARKAKSTVPVTPTPAPAVQSASFPSHILDIKPNIHSNITGVIDDSAQIIVRPKLSFDYQAAKEHLINADPRFAELFETLPCKPFEEETDLNPFRALCCSILGQQISWLAARSITHKFIRLVAYPELPEKLDPSLGLSTSFPTPLQVLHCPITTLRSAGLSQRKAEYVQELAGRFVDGRLGAKGLMEMSDEEVMKALVAIRGIGPWTVHMFMIFTLHRPDVLPVADLGVQKGLIRWLTMVNPSIHSRKKSLIPSTSVKKEEEDDSVPSANRQVTPPPPSTPSTSSANIPATPLPLSTPGPPLTPSTPIGPNLLQEPLMTPNTAQNIEAVLPPFPESKTLTRQSLKARLEKGKKVKGNNYLTPIEMEELTEAWKPYRSIGVWYLWSLADADTSFG